MGTRVRTAAGPPAKRRRLGAREPSVMEIIELTDSDGDDSLVPRQTLNAFGKPNAELLADVPGSSKNDVPLFLPASNDERRVVAPLPARPAHPQPLPSEPPRPPDPAPLDPVDEYIARVLEIIPDVEPAHALALIHQLMQSQPDNVVEFVIHALFENPSYPKVDKKGKHKQEVPDPVDANARASPRLNVDYTNKDRVYDCGPRYFERSLEQLMTDFPRIPKPHIRSRLFDNRFYAPTYLILADELKQVPLPFKLKSTNSVVSKGKSRHDPEFDKEREWVLIKIAGLESKRDAALAGGVNEQEYDDTGQGIECGCCFSEYPFDQMIQCPEAHLFCKSCMTSYASNLLGEHNPNIVCMDQSGCKLPFPESELGRFLSSKLLELYHRVKQRKEIEAAGLENLEECPFCEYKCVIENETEKLFRCENADCSAITCRSCKKPDHLPKSCKEADEDKHLDAQHVIEEAMTQALMRNCPKCQKSFIKEMGCNKMTCPNCHTVSCYICRKVINGYDHFSNPPPYTAGKVDKSKCNLWDPVEQRQTEEVTQAAKRALAELRKSRPDVDQLNIKLDMPKPGPGPGSSSQAQAHPGAPRMGGIGIGMAGPVPRVGAGAGMGMDRGEAGNQFMFGANQGHQFAAPPLLGAPALAAQMNANAHAMFPMPLLPQAAVAAGGGARRGGRRRKAQR